MKWGVRKKRPIKGARKRTTYNDDHDLTKLSDDDIRGRINRLQMEKQYLELTTPATKSSVVQTLGRKAIDTATNRAVQRGSAMASDAAFAYAMKLGKEYIKNARR